MSEIRPQPGPQEAFLASEADIAIYGGAAGGGKTFALLLEPLRHIENQDFGAVIFRRETTQVRNEGGLWDESEKLYGSFAGVSPLESRLEWEFRSGMRVKFAHLEHEKDKFSWQGAQIPFLGFDELTHFSESQFFYLFGRNRSTCGVAPYVRATCNPDSRSWVRRFISWWIDPKTGFAIPERSGKLRWFIRRDDKIVWADTREELVEKFGSDEMPTSVTFIASNVYDNKILLAKDPNYLAKLRALPKVERMRLLDGNWNVEPSAGMFFKKAWFEVVDAVPAGIEWIRYWDRASTEHKDGDPGDPDYTVGLKLGRDRKSGLFFVSDVVRDRLSPGKVETLVKNTASRDGRLTKIFVEQDPGQAGEADAKNFIRLLAGYDVRANRVSTAKETRALSVSAQAEAGNVKILRGAWNEDFFDEVENFPDGAHDDQVDALSGAFNQFVLSEVGEFTKDYSPPETSNTIARFDAEAW